MHQNKNYTEVAIIREEDGVCAVITEHVPTGRLTFSLCREFEQGGEIRRTSFLATRHGGALRRALISAESWIAKRADEKIAEKLR